MPAIGGGIQTAPTNACQPIDPNRLTRKRAVQLAQIGLKVCDYMVKLGIKKEEHCHFGNVMQQLLQYPEK